MTLNNSKKHIFSEMETTIIDPDKNKIFVTNFDYQIKNNIFKSIGSVEVFDNRK